MPTDYREEIAGERLYQKITNWPGRSLSFTGDKRLPGKLKLIAVMSVRPVILDRYQLRATGPAKELA